MAGAAVRRRQRFLRSMWRHEQTTIKMAFATCAHHSVQTASHRTKVAVCDQGVQVGVPRHHEFDVDSFPVSSDPVASDDDVGLVIPAVAEYTVPTCEHVAPAPAVTYAAPAPVVESCHLHLPLPQRLLQ